MGGKASPFLCVVGSGLSEVVEEKSLLAFLRVERFVLRSLAEFVLCLDLSWAV